MPKKANTALGTFLAAMVAWTCCTSAQTQETTSPLIPGIANSLPAAETTATTQTCCSGYADFRYEPLAFGHRVTAHIDAQSATYEFPTGKSSFAAYRLPDAAEPYTVTLKSYLHWEVFFPCALLLDDQFTKTRFITAPYVHYVEPGFIERGHLETNVQINPSRRERYLIILTSDDALSNQHDRLPGANLGAAHWQRRSFVPVGSVEVTVSRVKEAGATGGAAPR